MDPTISYPSPNLDDRIPTATLALPSPAAPSSRRLPPPCWSLDETVALIDAYRDKWYSLRRGNLRANHWQEVAADIASRCPAASPPKTAVQCRHKMEKLRKRYRAETQRAAANRGYKSSWAHFLKMQLMEKGPNPTTPPSSSDDEGEEEEEEEEESDHKNTSIKRIDDLYKYNNQKGVLHPETNGSTSGFRIKIPGRVTPGPSVAKVYSKFDEMGSGLNPNNPNPIFSSSVVGVNGAGSSRVIREGFGGRVDMGKRVGGEMLKKEKRSSGVGELVAAIQALGEGFMRMEKVKMDMARQVEEMRMEMELKRTEMILESEQRIVEAFVKSIPERSAKRAKKNSTTTPEC